MKHNRCDFYFILAVLTIFIFTVPATGIAQSRGLKIVAEDYSTKEWEEISLYNKAYAVIIGIDQYPNLPHDQQLSYAVSDAKAVERMLQSKFIFSKTYSLYNEQATKSNIMDVLLNKLSKVSKDDAVFIFYAGHGGQERTDYGEIGFIVPYDGNFTDMRKVISMTTIKEDISKRISAKHVFYVMDSCYSGLLVTKRSGGTKETKRNLTYLKQIAKEPVRQVLTAGSANQEVLDGGPGGHSVFTGRFLEILDNADDFITATEVSSLVKERVFSDANTRGHLQTPKFGELFGLGDFIFMPSVSKKIGDIKQQISDLERELREIEQAEEKASTYKDAAAKREAERKRKVAEAKLKAKKLEEQRLAEERALRKKRELERLARLEAQKKKQAEEDWRLASLQKKVDEKRTKYKTSMILSLDGALKEMQSLDRQINDIKAKYIEELKKRIMAIAENYSNSFTQINLEKDEFETEEEYQSRLAKQVKRKQSSNQEKFSQAMKTVENAYNEQIAPLVQQMREISKSKYKIYGHDALMIKLGKYNADKESFEITIASKNIKRPIYPQGRYLFVSNVSRQAKRAGIKKGDMLLKYNNIVLEPGLDWDRLKQSVITDTVDMEVQRDGRVLSFSLKKGRIGVDTYTDDYAKGLEPDQFIVNGELHVPRKDARKFKQNYLNGFITAELQVSTITPLISLVTGAAVVDESNDLQYDLFKSRFVNMGNRLTYDTDNNIIWLTKINQKLSLDGATNFVNRFEYHGLKGWELPTIRHMRSLKNTNVLWYFKRHIYYQTISDNKYPTYNPTKDSTCCERWGYVVAILPWIQFETDHFHNIFDLYKKDYMKISKNLVFDNRNKLLWINDFASNKQMTILEAKKYIKQLEYAELRGWRLPSLKEFKSLRDNTIPGLSDFFAFPHGYYQTITNNKYPTYNPRKDSTCCDRRGYVVGVM